MQRFLVCLICTLMFSLILVQPVYQADADFTYVKAYVYDSQDNLVESYIYQSAKNEGGEIYHFENRYRRPHSVEEEDRLLTMRRTVYVKDPRCIPDYKNPITSSGSRLQEGTAAINVLYRGGRWIYNSPLKMGDVIYVQDHGRFTIRDTGPFNPQDPETSYNTVDLFLNISYEEALEMGVEEVQIYIISREVQ